MKVKVDKFLNNSPIGSCLLIGLILTSIIAYALETEFRASDVLKMISATVAILFALEYILRIWSSSIRPKGRLGYIFSFYGLIDLIAFLPALLLPVASGTVVFRALRLLRLAQILKIQAVRNSIVHFLAALNQARNNLIVSFTFSAALIFAGAVTLYYVEGGGQPDDFGSIPRALWWSVAALTTVGYGDVYPITPLGKILASVMALIGIAAVAIPAGILAAAFTSVAEDKTEDD